MDSANHYYFIRSLNFMSGIKMIGLGVDAKIPQVPRAVSKSWHYPVSEFAFQRRNCARDREIDEE